MPENINLKNYNDNVELNINKKFTVSVKRSDVGFVIDVISLYGDVIDTLTIWDDDLG